MSLPVANLLFDGFGNGNSFRGREVFADFVLGIFARDDAVDVDDMGDDRLLLEDVPLRPKTPLSEYESELVRHADGL